jgi:hypothetical protein
MRLMYDPPKFCLMPSTFSAMKTDGRTELRHYPPHLDIERVPVVAFLFRPRLRKPLTGEPSENNVTSSYVRDVFMELPCGNVP